MLLANVMSLTPKIDEIRVFSKSIDIDLFFITETWLKNTINDNQVALSGYNLERLDRRIGVHGGVCLFSKIGIRTTRLLTGEFEFEFIMRSILCEKNTMDLQLIIILYYS